MTMFARFDENSAMTLQDTKETKRYGRTDARTHARTTCKQYTQHKQSLLGGNKKLTTNLSGLTSVHFHFPSVRDLGFCIKIFSNQE